MSGPAHPYAQDIDGCLAATIGDGGLAGDTLARELGAAEGAREELRARYRDGGLPLLRLPEARDDLAKLRDVSARLQDRFDDIVILGTGGSSLGGQALTALAVNPYGGDRRPRLHFMDNIDPAGFDALFAAVDAGRTGFIVISKSGGTAETIMQCLVCLDWARRGGSDLSDRFVMITEPGDNPLRRLADTHDCQVLDHDPGVGGRFSVLSLVGLLPALLVGIDAEAVRAGAWQVLDKTLTAPSAEADPPAAGAAVSIGLARAHAVSAHVVMPYCDQLGTFGFWYRQLWAESLGKDGIGTTPIRALGTVDQHSQLQLYLAGPPDKMYTLILRDVAGTGAAVDPELAGDSDLDYLRRRTMGDLLDAEQRATAETLLRNRRPTRRITLATLDAERLGALFMHFMLETIIAAHLLKVNAFDQPAVEQGKILARQYLAESAPS